MKKAISDHCKSSMNRAVRLAGMFFLASTMLSSRCAADTERGDKTAKYVLLFIGDGLAAPQRAAAEFYQDKITAKGKHNGQRTMLAMSEMPVHGMTTTYAVGALITDSAAAGTAMATGHKTRSGIVAMAEDGITPVKSIATLAKEQGMKVGIVSSVSIDHATPACFYANSPSRGNYHDIAMQLSQSSFDFFGGGRMLGDTPAKRKDRPSPVATAKKRGYQIVENAASLAKLKPSDQKVIAFSPRVDSAQAMPYHMDRRQGDISLADFTIKAIALLDNPKGFFLMVEGGKIDWACHANDAAAAIHDTLAFDAAVRIGISFYEKHPDETLVVVAGDHECGGLTIGFAGTRYNAFPDKIKNQKISQEQFVEELKPLLARKATFAEVAPLIDGDFGFGPLTQREQSHLKDAWLATLRTDHSDADRYLKYGKYVPLAIACTKLMANRAGLAWTTFSHTGVPVPTSAIGVHASLFNGYYDNTDIFHKIIRAMGLKTAPAETVSNKR